MQQEKDNQPVETEAKIRERVPPESIADTEPVDKKSKEEAEGEAETSEK